MGKIKLIQPGSLFISPVLHTQVFHKVDSNLRQPVLSPLKHFHTVTFGLLSLQMARSLWIVIWSGLNLANSCDLLVESQFFQHHSFVTQTAVYLLFLLLLLLLVRNLSFTASFIFTLLKQFTVLNQSFLSFSHAFSFSSSI